MKPKDESTIEDLELLLNRHSSKFSRNHQNIQDNQINTREKDDFSILLRSIFILFSLAIFFVAAIYYGIINP